MTAPNRLHDRDAKARAELTASRRWLFESDEGRAILDAAASVAGEARSAYVMAETPEQSEDLFVLLLDGERLVRIERARQSGVLSAELWNKTDTRQAPRVQSGKMSIAIELSRQDLES